MKTSRKNCPNCGVPVEGSARLCPNCGAVVPTFRTPSETAAALPPKLLTGRAWADLLTGAAVQYLAHLAATRALLHTVPRFNPAHVEEFIGITWDPNRTSAISRMTLLQALEVVVLGAVGYFAGRRFYPVVARGFGYATLTLFVVLLGAFFTCRLVSY